MKALKSSLSAVLALVFLTSAGRMFAAAPEAAVAAELIQKHQDALVEVHATMSAKPEVIEGPPGIAEMINQQKEEEEKVQAAGVVVDGKGLVAVPLVLLDPGSALGEALELDTPLGKLKIGVKTTLTSVKVVTADGGEHAAEVVLKEPAAGLALLKLTVPPAAGMATVALTKDLPAPQPFARIYDLSRLGADFGRATAVRVLRVVQTTAPPFPMHDITGPVSAPGSAAFDEEGRFLGLMVIPVRMKGGAFPNISPFLLPQGEILRLGAKAMP